MSAIPQREPIGDPFTGAVVQVAGQTVLYSDDLPTLDDGVSHDSVTLLHSGSMIVRYGIRYLGKPHLSIVPGLLALDYGEMLTGEAMWAFILKKSNLYPRADVLGHRSDGSDEMMQIKWLDLALPVEVLVYASVADTQPIAHPIALIAPAADSLPPRILEHLPRFDRLTDWFEKGKQ
jgi:hypothetical protein